ncbi:MAG: Ig-like domain-containing protein [Acholeplasmatales bacterium]|nr:Ig-like domain-containing protein [Acholeplasmatales bacterium]
MKKRKLLLGLAIASTSLLALAACGSKKESSSAAASSAAASSEVASSAATSSAATSSAAASSAAASSAAASSAAASSVASSAAAAEEVTAITMNGVEYETIKAALAAVPTSGDTSTYTIKLPKGTYEENGLAYNGTATIKISGDTTTEYGADVIIKGHGSDMTTEKTRSLVAIQGSGNIILENLTLLSDWTRAGAAAAGISNNTQAEVLGTDTTGKTVAYNCSFLSHQDTLRTAGKAWFYGCYIEGDVDFLWMEQAGIVALYEKCEIVSTGDDGAASSYLCAPRMSNSETKVGKGLVIYNSTVKEKTESVQTYLARTPWSSGYYNQVAYINTTCTGVEAAVWYKTQIATDYDKTAIGWKMDQATATSLGYAGNGDIISTDDTTNEFGGRRAILNRIYNTTKKAYEKDSSNNFWDIDALITENAWTVDNDTSKVLLDGETESTSVTYAFDGSVDQSALCNGFAQEGTKTHYKGGAGATITIPVEGKCYVEVKGYYSGTATMKADTQNESVMFFNNNTTGSKITNSYVVYDANATNVVLTAAASTYITDIVVTYDDNITETKVSSINITKSSDMEAIGVALTLTAKTNTDATNQSVKWSSSNETIATIDQYSGKITFLTEGEVTFTATACDGSGITGTVTCNPVDTTWVQAEWYTTDSTTATQENATNIKFFDPGASAYKQLSNNYTFTDLAGNTVTTNCGLKLNSSGVLTIATTKGPATLTLVLSSEKDVTAPSVTNEAGTAVTAASTVTDTTAGTVTFVYELTTTGTWTIVRGAAKEAAIVYALCEYDVIWDFQNNYPSTNSKINIQGGSADTPTEGTIVSNYSDISLTVISTGGKFAYNAAGYVQMNANTTVRVPVTKAGEKVTVVSYSGQSNYTIGTGTGAIAVDKSTDTDVYTVTADDVATGYVEIVAAGTGYIYSIMLSK